MLKIWGEKSCYRSLIIIVDTATLLRDTLVSQIFIIQAEALFQKARQLPSKGPFTFLQIFFKARQSAMEWNKAQVSQMHF